MKKMKKQARSDLMAHFNAGKRKNRRHCSLPADFGRETNFAFQPSWVSTCERDAWFS